VEIAEGGWEGYRHYDKNKTWQSWARE
jgi:hypothetical protein